MIVGLVLTVLLAMLFLRSQTKRSLSEVRNKNDFLAQKNIEVDEFLKKKPSRVEIENFRTLIEQEVQSVQTTIPQTEVVDLKSALDKVYQKLQKAEKLKINKFFDTNIIQEGIETSVIFLYANHLFLADNKMDKIYRIDRRFKSSKVFRSNASEELVGFLTIKGKVYVFDKKAQILPLEGGEKILLSNTNENLLVQAFDFWNNTLFVLEKSQGLLTKNMKTADSSKESYFADEILLNQSTQKTGINVNGFVYLYDTNGIERFQGGEKKSLSNSIQLLEGERIEQVIALENSQILVITSSGRAFKTDENLYVVAQYQEPALSGAKWSIFDPKSKTLFVVKNNEIFEVGL